MTSSSSVWSKISDRMWWHKHKHTTCPCKLIKGWLEAFLVCLMTLLSPLLSLDQFKSAHQLKRQVRSRTSTSSGDCHFQDLIEQVRDHAEPHFRLYLDGDDLLTSDDALESQWNDAWQTNKQITQVTITISEPFSRDSSGSSVLRRKLNRLLQVIGHLPHLQEICLSDIFDDQDVYIFPISLVTQWLHQAKQLKRLTFYMAHLALATEEQEDLVGPLREALLQHPSLTTLEFDHCTYHHPQQQQQQEVNNNTSANNNNQDSITSTEEDRLYQVFLDSAMENWNLGRIAFNSSYSHTHPLQDIIDYHCKLNHQRKEWYAHLYQHHSKKNSDNDQTATRQSNIAILGKLTGDLDSLHYYLSQVNPNILTGFHSEQWMSTGSTTTS